MQAAKQLARERIFQNERKAKLEIGAYTTLGILLEAFIGAAHELHHTGHSSFKHQRVLALIGENTRYLLGRSTIATVECWTLSAG